jgi:hypothetical protein
MTQAESTRCTVGQWTWRRRRAAPTPIMLDDTTVEVLTGAPSTAEPRITAA